MALRYLATTVSSRALRRAWGPAPSVRPAAGSRLLSSYRSSQSGAYPDMEEMLRRSDCLREERNRALKIVQERCFKEIELWNKEWADFEKVVRRDLQDLARFNEKALNIADVTACISFGALVLAIGVKCLM
ncbi:unnamed protein product [Urochloa humidicola]